MSLFTHLKTSITSEAHVPNVLVLGMLSFSIAESEEIEFDYCDC